MLCRPSLPAALRGRRMSGPTNPNPPNSNSWEGARQVSSSARSRSPQVGPKSRTRQPIARSQEPCSRITQVQARPRSQFPTAQVHSPICPFRPCQQFWRGPTPHPCRPKRPITSRSFLRYRHRPRPQKIRSVRRASRDPDSRRRPVPPSLQPNRSIQKSSSSRASIATGAAPASPRTCRTFVSCRSRTASRSSSQSRSDCGRAAVRFGGRTPPRFRFPKSSFEARHLKPCPGQGSESPKVISARLHGETLLNLP